MSDASPKRASSSGSRSGATKTPAKGGAGALAGGAALLLLKILFWVVALLLPLTGAWLLSSLTAYANGPTWLAIVALFFLFPILPGAWEGIGAFRRSRQKEPGERVLTLGDRLLLRTLAVNVLFVGGLLVATPETGVRALLARGDWMLDGSTSKAANKAREILLGIADRFEWIYRAAHRESYEDGKDGEAKRKDGDKSKEAVRVDRSIGVDDPDGAPRPKDGDPPKPDGDQPPPKPEPAPDAEIPIGGGRTWPEPEKLAEITVGLEPPTIDALGAALREGAPEPFARAKAIHDWIADRVAYDYEAYDTNKFPPQDAATVFKTHTSVCAGYSNLFAAVAKAAGLEAEVVVGAAKGSGGEVDGRGHAWNAVKLEGAWYLLDVTWNAGVRGDDKRFEKKYRTDYLFTPPEIFRNDHFPEVEKWQLAPPISRGDFMRAPQLEPAFYKRGMKLVSPTRSQTSVGSTAKIVVENPKGQYMLVTFIGAGAPDESKQRCDVVPGPTIQVTCKFPSKGDFRVILFGASERYTTYWSMGELQFLADP